MSMREPSVFKPVTNRELFKSGSRVFWHTLKQQGFSAAARVLLILWVLYKAGCEFAKYHALDYAWLQTSDASTLDTEQRALSLTESEQYHKLGVWLRTWLTRFGPAFIKVGQMLATRADLLPLPVMLELAALQEDLPPFEESIAREMIIQELGAPPEVLFRRFDPVPIAAASLSQAYKASIFDGREVVVKVQRPNLEQVISKDAQILEIIAQEANIYEQIGKHTDWVGVVHEFRRATMQEIDYIQEGRNVNAFRHDFRKFDHIVIPRIIWTFTTKKILTLEYIPGARINDRAALAAQRIDPRKITALGAKFYLKQLFEDGVFHADPHPGNLRIMPGGTIGIFDFGMVGRISPILKQSMTKALMHVAQGEYRALIDDFVEMGCLSPSCDRDALCQELTPILEIRFSQGLSQVRFRKLLFDFSELVYRYPFKLPVEFTYIMRALLMLEGIALSIDPEFNFLDVAMPFVEGLLLKQTGVYKAIFEDVFPDGKFSLSRLLGVVTTASRLYRSGRSSRRNGNGHNHNGGNGNSNGNGNGAKKIAVNNSHPAIDIPGVVDYT
jgi:predicted unusual protein kinase regulating ubiquinone biosynthesis (AarF/ABC1/UbiB family)